MAPGFNGADNSQELPIIDLIIAFCGSKALGEITTGVVFPILISLQKDTSGCDFGGISGDGELLGGIRVSEDRFRKEAVFKLFEGFH